MSFCSSNGAVSASRSFVAFVAFSSARGVRWSICVLVVGTTLSCSGELKNGSPHAGSDGAIEAPSADSSENSHHHTDDTNGGGVSSDSGAPAGDAGAGWLPPPQQDPVRAFPGAEGFGAVSVGGRGGQVIRVTTLDASGPGSLLEAVQTPGPRIIVFAVSGVIRGDIDITHPNLTIAGQTAPGAGITIEGRLRALYGDAYDIHDITVRFLRVRPRRSLGSGGDAIQMPQARRIILDHVSTSWANDESIDLYWSSEITVQWSTIEESDLEGHDKGEHAFGMINAAEGSGAISVHHNLFAHQQRRVPSMSPYRENAPGDFSNNVVYDVLSCLGHDGHGPNVRSPINMVGNYFKVGPGAEANPNGDNTLYPFGLVAGVSYHIAGNYIFDWGDVPDPRDWSWGSTPSWIQFNQDGNRLALPATVTPTITRHSAAEAYDLVLAQAGALPRDRVTLRTVQEVSQKGGTWGRSAPLEPDDAWFLQGLTPGTAPADADNDGMADSWEAAHGLDSSDSTDHAKVMPSGYTAIEDYVNGLAAALIANVTSP